MGKRLLMPSGACKRVGRVGVQALVSYLCARLTLEEAAETLMRLVPLTMSAPQALSLMRPVSEARGRAALCTWRDRHGNLRAHAGTASSIEQA